MITQQITAVNNYGVNTMNNTTEYLEHEQIIETETFPLPNWPEVPELSHLSDYELIGMYQKDRNERALLCLAQRYECLATKTLAPMKDNWEYNDRKQEAFVTLIEVLPTIKLERIQPKNYPRCLYSWYRQALWNTMRTYRKQLGDIRESKNSYGDTCICQRTEFDETLYSNTDREVTGFALAKIELFDLFTEEESFAVEMYITHGSFTGMGKSASLYRFLKSAKEKIKNFYAENNIKIAF
jgi:hypothetical protein